MIRMTGTIIVSERRTLRAGREMVSVCVLSEDKKEIYKAVAFAKAGEMSAGVGELIDWGVRIIVRGNEPEYQRCD